MEERKYIGLDSVLVRCLEIHDRIKEIDKIADQRWDKLAVIAAKTIERGRYKHRHGHRHKHLKVVGG